MFRDANMKRLTILALAAPLAALPAFADNPPKAWTGEGVFGAGVTTGNTDTEDLGVALRAKHTGTFWSQSAELTADYGETDDVATKQRYSAALQADFLFGEHASSFGRFTWERDEFSGFDNRYFIGAGLAYKVLTQPDTTWTVQGGPGYRIDEIRAAPTAVPPTQAANEQSFGASAGSHFQHKFNPNVALTNDTDVTYSKTSTQYKNGLALTFDIMGDLQARISYDIRHETDPLPGFKANDTQSKFSLVYKVG